MTFLAPLAALFALSLPLIVALHLRRSRSRPLPVTTLRFWREATRDRRERLALRPPPRALLLLAQLAIAALLCLALARPALPLPGLPGNAARRQTIVVLDRSTAMRATDVGASGAEAGSGSGRRGEAATRFDAAKARARALVGGAAIEDEVTLLTLGADPRLLHSRDGGDRAALLAALDALGPGGGRADLNGALPTLRAAILPERETRIVLLSGGPFADPPDRAALAALPATLEWERIGGAADNLAVTRLVARRSPLAADRVELFARIANYAATPLAGRSRIVADGAAVDERPLSLAAGGTVELVWQLPRGTREAALQVEGATPDALPLDDEARVVLREPGAVRILLVSDAPATGDLGRALAAQPGATLVTVAPGAYSEQVRADLTVFERFVPPALPRGGVLLVNPPPDNPLLASSGRPETPRLARLDRESPLLDGVDLGGVTFPAREGVVLPAWAQEVAGAEGGPLILAGNVEGREVVAFAFDLAGSNLPRKLAFPLLIGNVVERLQTHRVPAEAPLGAGLLLEPVAGTAGVRLREPGGEERDLELRGSAGGAPAAYAVFERPGRYTLSQRDDAGNVLLQESLAVNGGDAIASNLRAVPDDLPVGAGAAPPAGAEPASVGAAAPRRLGELWPLLLALALALLTFEWLLGLLAPAAARGLPARVQPRAGLRGGR